MRCVIGIMGLSNHLQNRYRLDIDQVEKMIHDQGLAVILASNPRNPTGQVME
jgi:bifunctional pyridoxal-dependent enzyme with beta-cystathionase and maltose regulon repressor activities